MTNLKDAIKEKPQFFSNSTYNAFLIIEEMAKIDDPGYISILDLSKKLSQNKSAVYRILNTLTEMGYLDKNDSKYRLGYKFMIFSEAVVNRINIHTIAKPIMEELANKINERVFLALADKEQNEVVQMDLIEGNPWIRLTSQVGSRFPLYSSSSGKVFLSEYSQENLQKYIRGFIDNETPEGNIVSEEKLLQQIENVKRNGYAVADEECRIHERAVSAPIVTIHGSIIAAIGIAGPTLTFTHEKLADAIPELITAAKKIAHRSHNI